MTKAAGNGLPTAVLLAGEAIALSAARGLRSAGAEVIGLGHHEDPLRNSRLVSKFVDVGSGDEMQGRLMAALARECPRGAVLIPCDDEPLELIAARSGELEALGFRLAEGRPEVIGAMLDKRRTHEIARAAGLAVPRSIPATSAAEAVEAGAAVGFPCAVKPIRSHRWRRSFGIATKALTAANPRDLELAAGRAFAEAEPELMVCELIPGGDDACWSWYAYVGRDGEPLAEATKHKLRQYPPGLGQSTLNALEWSADAAEAGRRFARAARLLGVAYVEFKRDPRDGELKLIECNHRLVGPNELFRRAGFDLAAFAYLRAAGGDPHPPRLSDHDGSALIWPMLDFRSALRASGNLSGIRAWAYPLLGRRLHLPIFAWRDPIPSLARGLRRVSRRLRRAARRSRS